ncbi:MAG: ImmA/IrrE family metallo-endopeptidase [Pseudomonadota bacterium]
MNRVSVNPRLLQWARERAGMDMLDLEERFPKLGQWESEEAQPTLKQLEGYAKATHAPIGYFFLPAPPEEPLPIPDFRTMAGRNIARPSPNLLDTIYACQERQSWYRDFAQVTGQPPLAYVGSLTTDTSAVEAAVRMRQTLGFDLDARRDCPTWTEALRRFIEQADQIGVLVMVSGVVLNNNRRHLDPDEFRGFALADSLAPLVFINGADTKAAQMFTLAHELAHLWLGASALSDTNAASVPDHAVETWCNRVAAEMLVPLEVFRSELHADEPVGAALARLAKRFKVSTLVILRRLMDAGAVARQEFDHLYDEELQRLVAVAGGSGGNFYRTTAARVSRRFARALVESTMEGRTLYRDAFRMLGISKSGTFNEFGRSLGFNL